MKHTIQPRAHQYYRLTFDESEGKRQYLDSLHRAHSHVICQIGGLYFLYSTPQRVVNAYQEFFAGYHMNPEAILSTTFEEVEGYDEMVIVKDIRLESYCEHHMVPILGKAHVAYIPSTRVVGISKLARIVDVYAKRLQTQETMTAQIADTIQRVLQPKGVAVVIDAMHQCMTTRGVHKPESSTVTSRMLGLFRKDPKTRAELMTLLHG